MSDGYGEPSTASEADMQPLPVTRQVEESGCHGFDPNLRVMRVLMTEKSAFLESPRDVRCHDHTDSLRERAGLLETQHCHSFSIKLEAIRRMLAHCLVQVA